jgi:hypothetical protein
MRLAQPGPPFAHRRQPLGAHAKGEFGHKDFLGVVVFVDRALIGLRELRRAVDDRGEHGVEFERGIDRAQNFFERLQFADRAGQFVGAGRQLGEEPRVLNRDHRLIGKGADQFDLPLAERLDPFPREIDRAEHGPLAQQPAPQACYVVRTPQSRVARSPGQRRCPRYARPGPRAPPARQGCCDQRRPVAGAKSPNTQAPL